MNLQTLKKWPDLSLLAGSLLIGLIVFTLTNPQHVPPLVLVVGFFVLFGNFYAILRLITKAAGLKERLKAVQYNGLTAGVAALLVMLVALQSIGQLTVRDSLTLVILYTAGYFYIVRQRG